MNNLNKIAKLATKCPSTAIFSAMKLEDVAAACGVSYMCAYMWRRRKTIPIYYLPNLYKLIGLDDATAMILLTHHHHKKGARND